MQRVTNPRRVEKLIKTAINAFALDLQGIAVLTEAASGNFAVTPLIAALAGAERVVALTRDSGYGAAVEVEEYVMGWATDLGIADRIEVTAEREYAFSRCSLVTNLGFVRPIDARMIAALPEDAAIALMWEPWEFRESDLDLSACRARGIPVLGTCESDARLETFRYLGPVVLKLLLTEDIEVFRGRFLVIGEEPFLSPVVATLNANGAGVRALVPSRGDVIPSAALEQMVSQCDAMIVIDHRSGRPAVGAGGVPVAWLAESGVALVHVCGHVDDDALTAAGIAKIPARRVPLGYMTVTTDFIGPRPVIDLHAAGLKVGEILVRGRRLGLTPAAAASRAVAEGLALGFS